VGAASSRPVVCLSARPSTPCAARSRNKALTLELREGGTVTRRAGAGYLSGPGYDIDWLDGSAAYLDPIGR